MLKILSFILSILPPPPRFTKKEAAMPEKTKPRTLGAEPLEERLPISSSAAGVLFGLGLANDTTTAAYEAPQTPRSESVAQPTLIDLTLDLQLDALAVDLFHAEESLLDTISSASEDPFVLTPLTPDAALSDTNDDAHRELGDELLLYQISTLDFTEVSFEPVTPHHGFARHDFGDALTPPEDLTAYGYSPIANELQDSDDEGGSRCGGNNGGSCGCVPYITSASVTKCGAGCSGTAQANYNCSTGQHSYSPANVPHPATIFVFQTGDTASVITNLTWGGGGTGSVTVTPNATPGGGAYWSLTTVSGSGGALGQTWIWTKPAGLQNNDPSIQRDFTFTYTVTSSSGNATPVSLYVHITYVEVLTQFAGEGGFKAINVKGDKTDQTAANTVVIGQKVEAEYVYDPVLTLNISSYNQFSTPTGGSFVKDYITNDAIGLVIEHDQNDYICTYFDYYYTSKAANTNTGSISCSGLALKDPNGITHTNLAAGASFYIEEPILNPLSFYALMASWDNSTEPPVGVRPYTDPNVNDPNAPDVPDGSWLILGGTPEDEKFVAGITWYADVGAPPVIGGGKIAYNQQIRINDAIFFHNKDEKQKMDAMGRGFMLDTSFPYGGSDWIKDVDEALTANDSPGQPLGDVDTQFYNKFLRSDSYETYLIYKPEGHEDHTIWVTLSLFKWSWVGMVVYNTTTGEWDLTMGISSSGGLGTPTSHLPEWDKNFENHRHYVSI